MPGGTTGTIVLLALGRFGGSFEASRLARRRSSRRPRPWRSSEPDPNQYLLVGRHGTLENRGSAVQVFLRPGTIHLLVPGTKQEAAFEFTQETRDGIPLRFKGTVLYRITDPVAAAKQFDFRTATPKSARSPRCSRMSVSGSSATRYRT